jgi:hypothetical protein
MLTMENKIPILLVKNLILGVLDNFNKDVLDHYFKSILDFHILCQSFYGYSSDDFLIFSKFRNSWFFDALVLVDRINSTLFKNVAIKVLKSQKFRYATRVSFVGLGMRVFPTKQGNFLRLDIGLSHFIILKLGQNVRARWKRKQLTLVGPSRGSLKTIINTLMRIKKPSPYKKRGLISSLWHYRQKIGKKR